MTTITPGGLTADRVAVEARPEVEDRFLLVALVNVAVAIAFTALAIAYDLPAALGVDTPDRLGVTGDAMSVGTALSAPLPLIVLFAFATMVALQGGRGRKLAAAGCALYGVVTALAFLGAALSSTPLTGSTLFATIGLQVVGVICSAGLAFTAGHAVLKA
jgi:hypothetical protein